VRRVQDVVNCSEEAAVNALLVNGGNPQQAIDSLYF
jgi:NACalpha-BTF3-like transcription factor